MRNECLVLSGLLATLSGTAAGCATDGEAWVGEALPGPPLKLRGANEGIHPDRSVLDDPANPFARGALADATIWELQRNGGPVAAFYAWATATARGPSGERQYYTALDLKAIYEGAQADAADLPVVRDHAIRGFQAMLDYFPAAVTYDATGTIAFELATPSVEAILALGGEVSGGWILVTRPDGSQVAVRR